jgi:bifunctional DNA-binding transcriptional regulator/antitoxin component of YhaV-PrlF toxin-antitoxin module
MRKINQTQVRNIQKSGGSYYVTLPIEVVRGLGWKEKQKVVITRVSGKKIEIKDWK